MNLLFDLMKALQIEALAFLDLEKKILQYVIPILGHKVALGIFHVCCNFLYMNVSAYNAIKYSHSLETKCVLPVPLVCLNHLT
jgi:hypothetical protein